MVPTTYPCIMLRYLPFPPPPSPFALPPFPPHCSVSSQQAKYLIAPHRKSKETIYGHAMSSYPRASTSVLVLAATAGIALVLVQRRFVAGNVSYRHANTIQWVQSQGYIREYLQDRPHRSICFPSTLYTVLVLYRRLRARYRVKSHLWAMAHGPTSLSNRHEIDQGRGQSAEGRGQRAKLQIPYHRSFIGHWYFSDRQRPHTTSKVLDCYWTLL